MFDEKYLPKFNEFSQRDKLLKTNLISKYIDSSVCFEENEKLSVGSFDNESSEFKLKFASGRINKSRNHKGTTG